MRRAVTAAAMLAVLGGCIPQVEPPYRGDAPPRPRPARAAPNRQTPARQTSYRQAREVPRPATEAREDQAEPRRDDDRPGRDEPVPRNDDRWQDDSPRSDADERPRAPSPPQRDREMPIRSADRDLEAMPQTKTVWEARPVTPTAVSVDDTSYVVKPGDTLGSIALRTGAGEGAIAQANGLEPPFAVRVGQRLTVPGGRYHVVGSGQSGIAIARAYGVEWSRIVAANALAEPFVLRIGQRVLIPGVAAGSSSLADRAAAFTLDVDDILTGGEPAQAAGQVPVKPATTPRRVPPPTAVVAAPARLRGGFLWPVEGRVVKRFGPGASGERNDGIKIAVPLGSPVHSVADGVVAYAGSGIAALGGLVIIRHGDGWTSVYGHAATLLVRRGQAVKQGQTIAISGDTGFADRPELHFELRKGRTPVDPQAELPKT
jgi:lipoprotein NlpD